MKKTNLFERTLGCLSSKLTGVTRKLQLNNQVRYLRLGVKRSAHYLVICQLFSLLVNHCGFLIICSLISKWLILSLTSRPLRVVGFHWVGEWICGHIMRKLKCELSSDILMKKCQTSGYLINMFNQEYLIFHIFQLLSQKMTH